MTPTQKRQPRHDDRETNEAIGRAIQVLRTAAGMNRRELAELAGVSYPYLSEIENGAKPGSPRVLRAIAEALGVPLHELLASADSLNQTMAAPLLDADVRPAMAAPPTSWFRSVAQVRPAQEAVRDVEGQRAALIAELRSIIERLSEDDVRRLIDLGYRMLA